MLRLMLLRHAKSDRGLPGASDHDRPLNPRGLEAAPKVGVYMAEHGLAPDLALASTAARARQTLDLALAAFHKALPTRGQVKIVSDRRLYLASAERILEVVAGTPPAVHTLLV